MRELGTHLMSIVEVLYLAAYVNSSHVDLLVLNSEYV